MALYMYPIDPEFVNLLKYRLKLSEGQIENIYDGCAYKDSEFFNERFNLSFTLNYDGAPKFKSSNIHIWPILMYINELPPNIR